MPNPDAVKERIKQLIGGGQQFKDEAQAKGWLVAAHNALWLVCPNHTAYAIEAKRIMEDSNSNPSWRSFLMAAILPRLLEDLEFGLLVSIENRAIAVTFDTFLDYGMEHLKAGRKNEAGMIAGIVFEDTIRQICRLQAVTDDGVKLDTLIAELAKANVLTGLKAKRARAAAGLRTSAAHARWDEFTLEDVRPVIDLSREIMASHLESVS